MGATFTIPSIFTAIDKFTGPVRAMSTAVMGFAAKSEVALSRVDRMFRGLMTPLNALRRTLNSVGLYVGIWVLLRAMQAAAGVMMDFEQANVNIGTVIEKKEIPLMKEMSKQARIVAVNYGVAASSVSDLQYELLKMGNSAKSVLAMTQAVVTGAVAMRTTPEKMAELAGGVFKSRNIDLEKNPQIAKDYIDKLALAANLTAADFESYATQLPIVNSVAEMANVEYEKVLAMLGATRDLQIHTATASTSLKNMMLDIMVKQRKTFDEAIGMINKIAEKDKTVQFAFEKYGKKTVVTATGLKQIWGRVEEIYGKLKDPTLFAGYAQKIALLQLESTRGHLKLLSAAYQELILTIDDGNGGPMSTAIKRYANIVSAMLLLTSGSEAAASRLEIMDRGIVETAQSALVWVKVILQIIKYLLILKALTIAYRAALIAYNIALGVSVALGWGNVYMLRASALAMGLYRVIVGTVTAAQWLLNAAMAANPIGLIIAAIALLASWLLICAQNWDTWGAAAAMMIGGLGLILNMVMSIADKWESIKSAFTDGGFISGIKAIGMAVYDAILYPLQQMLSIIGQIKGFEWATRASTSIQNYRANMGMQKMDLQAERSSSEKREYSEKNVSVDVRVPFGSVVNGSDENVNIKPYMGSTHGWQMSY